MNEHMRSWSVEQAKAKFNEVIRRARSDGPQRVTSRGRHVATIVAPEPEPMPGRKLTGAEFAAALQSGPGDSELSDILDKIHEEDMQFAQRVSELLAKDDAEKALKTSKQPE